MKFRLPPSGVLASVGIVALFLVLFYRTVLLHPNQVWLEQSPDGFKNYYTPWYHVLHDTSYTWFNGMNHPWGEHVTFTDCQPLVSNTLRFIHLNIAPIAPYTVGILNLLMLFTLFPTALILRAILCRWRVEQLYAGIAAAGITLLTPQIMRMFGHYALSYTFIIPLVWLLWLQGNEKPRLFKSLQVAAVVFLAGWVHPYFMTISAAFLTALWGVQFLLYRRHTSWKSIGSHWFIQALLPVVLFQLAMMLTDPVTDRPGSPYGITDYKSNLWSLVLPYANELFYWTKKIPAVIPEWEGYAYLGVSALLVLLFFVLRWLWRVVIPKRIKISPPRQWFGSRIRKKIARGISPSLSPAVTISVLAAILIFMLACGFPFTLHSAKMPELFPPIKQFRSLGRFSWVFYYVWGVFAFYFIWVVARKMRQSGKKGIATAFTVLPLLLIFTEAGLYNYGRQRSITLERDSVLADEKLELPVNEWIKKINPADYSGILFLPYFHIGSENLDAGGGEFSIGPAFRASLSTGLPLVNVIMSRTSLDQTWLQLQAVSEYYRPLEITGQYKNRKPLLLVKTANPGRLKGEELLRHAELLYKNSTVEVYRLSYENMKAAGAPMNLADLQKFNLPDTLYRYGSFLVTAPDVSLHMINYDSVRTENAYSGPGSLTFNRQHAQYLYKGKLGRNGDSRILISSWVKMRQDKVPTTTLGIEEVTPQGENAIWELGNFSFFLKAQEGEWGLIERECWPRNEENETRVLAVRWDTPPLDITMDELLIRHDLTTVVGMVEGKFYYNNLRYKLESPALFDSLMKNKIILDWK